MLTWLTNIFVSRTDCGGESEHVGYEEYETRLLVRLIDRFENFAGVEVEDANGNPLDPENLPNPNAPDGGLDCVIMIYPEDYTPRGLKWTTTRVTNILDNTDF